MPLWARWALAILFFACLFAALAIFVGGAHEGVEPERSEASAVAEANHVGEVAIAEDEAPRGATLAAHASALSALERAITADVHVRIAHGQLTGPLQAVRCRVAGAARAGRRPFSCTVTSAGISYPFLAVADARARRLTWCKLDPPPIPGGPLDVPVSASCRV